jgi:hypothetical protein
MFFAHRQLHSVCWFRGKTFPRVKALAYQTFGVPLDDVNSTYRSFTESATNTGSEGALAELAASGYIPFGYARSPGVYAWGTSPYHIMALGGWLNV